VRSSRLPYEMHSVGFRAFKSPLYQHRRANRTDLKKKTLTLTPLPQKIARAGLSYVGGTFFARLALPALHLATGENKLGYFRFA